MVFTRQQGKKLRLTQRAATVFRIKCQTSFKGKSGGSSNHGDCPEGLLLTQHRI